MRPVPLNAAGPIQGGKKPVVLWGIAVVLLVLAAGGLVWLKLGKEKEARPLERVAVPTTNTSAGATAGASESKRAGKGGKEFAEKMNQGAELLTEGKPVEAAEVLTEAMRLNPEDEDVHYNLGLALARQGKLDDAVKQYEEALRIFPKYVEVHNNLGNALMRLGRTEEAIEHFETAVKIMPDYASAHNNLGTALQRVGRTNDALTHFERAAKINPDYWEAHFNVGTSCLQSGRLNEAKSEFERVLALKPDFGPAKAALAETETRQAGGTGRGP